MRDKNPESVSEHPPANPHQYRPRDVATPASPPPTPIGCQSTSPHTRPGPAPPPRDACMVNVRISADGRQALPHADLTPGVTIPPCLPSHPHPRHADPPRRPSGTRPPPTNQNGVRPFRYLTKKRFLTPFLCPDTFSLPGTLNRIPTSLASFVLTEAESGVILSPMKFGGDPRAKTLVQRPRADGSDGERGESHADSQGGQTSSLPPLP